MTRPSSAEIFAVLDATWPAARLLSIGPWLLRQGRGGGQRVSAATAEDAFSPPDFDTMEEQMRTWGQSPLFMIREGEDALDAALSGRGYEIVDPVVLYLADAKSLSTDLPMTAAMPSWPPLAIQRELWQAGGIGPARVAVMERVTDPKTALLGRSGDTPSGAAFVAVHGNISMVHAIEVAPENRRCGVGRRLMQGCANWARGEGATWLTLAVTRANSAANALYRELGMEPAGGYHYRRLIEEAT